MQPYVKFFSQFDTESNFKEPELIFLMHLRWISNNLIRR